MTPLEVMASKQLGLVTTEQLGGLGLSTRKIAYRVEQGSMIRVRRGVYRLAGARPTWEQCLLAALLAAPTGSVASHLAAARIWRMRGINGEMFELTCTRDARLEGVVSHRAHDLARDDITRRGMVPVTAAARTLVDLSGVVPGGILGRALDEALRADQTTLVAVERCALRLLPAHGRRSLRSIRELITDRREGPELGDSPLESKILGWIRADGLPDPVTQYRLYLRGKQRRVDAAYPELRIAMEFNGWGEHGKRSAVGPDLTRRNAIEIDGWLLLEFADDHRRDEVITTVRAAREAQAMRFAAPA